MSEQNTTRYVYKLDAPEMRDTFHEWSAGCMEVDPVEDLALKLHQMLYPENYPGWDVEEDGECHEWSSDTIVDVAEMVSHHLRSTGHPAARFASE